MYGTVNEVCAKLRRAYSPEQNIALIVWSEEDVRETLPDADITPGEAAEIVANITSLDGVHEYGVGQETIQVMLDGIREEAEKTREMTVPAAGLALVIRLAGAFLAREDAEGGEGSGRRHYPHEAAALDKLRSVTER